MARVNKIIRFSCIDGPGNRMAIFFQGCNFRCTYCHNPETINHCTNCGICLVTCPSSALSKIEDKVFWSEKKCTHCDRCINSCPHLSSPKTKSYSVEELFQEIKSVAPFIEGITVSGGEATLNIPFLIELFKKVKNELNLTCFVDTNGGIDLSLHPEFIEITDKFMLDIKSIDSQEHRTVTGVDNSTVLKNLTLLLDMDKLHEVRTVVAPNMENEKTIAAVTEIIKGRCHYKLNYYREHGVREEGLQFHRKNRE
ncbi:MAG: YjjW family glycine radical enzyme activase [Fusobacteriaceae bacterium]